MPKTWVTVDLACGKVEATVEGGDGWWNPSLVDGDAFRLYRLATTGFDAERETEGP